jgi:uncharacterized membrane protein
LVVVASFKDSATAESAYHQLKRGDNATWLQDVAVIQRADSKVKFKESQDAGFSKGAVAGAVVGALAGLFTGGLAWVALGGAAIGGLAAKMHDANLPDATLKKLGEGLRTGEAAIVAVVDENLVPQAEDALKRMGAQVVTEGLDDETVNRLQVAAGTPPAEAPPAGTPPAAGATPAT